MYRVYDSLGNLMRKFSTYQAAVAYKLAYGNSEWTVVKTSWCLSSWTIK